MNQQKSGRNVIRVSDVGAGAWHYLKPRLPLSAVGRPRKLSMRQVVNSIMYVLKQVANGGNCRANFRLGARFTTIFAAGCIAEHGNVYIIYYVHDCEKSVDKHPTVGCLDSQSVKCTGVPGPRGFDAGKKINGRKRHIQVDTLGLLLTVVVSRQGQDRDGARVLLRHLPGSCKKLKKIWVDGSYSGRLLGWVTERFKFYLIVVLRPKETRKFVLLPRCWVIERTFGWLNHSRRLSKSYECFTRTDETWVYIVMIRIMLRRLA